MKKIDLLRRGSLICCILALTLAISAGCTETAYQPKYTLTEPVERTEVYTAADEAPEWAIGNTYTTGRAEYFFETTLTAEQTDGFIDMAEETDRKALLSYLEEVVKKDPIKTTVVEMTKLNLVELTRKKIHKPLHEQLAALRGREEEAKENWV